MSQYLISHPVTTLRASIIGWKLNKLPNCMPRKSVLLCPHGKMLLAATWIGKKQWQQFIWLHTPAGLSSVDQQPSANLSPGTLFICSYHLSIVSAGFCAVNPGKVWIFKAADTEPKQQFLGCLPTPAHHFCTMLYWNIQVVCGFIFVHGLFICCTQLKMSSLRTVIR